MSAAEVGSRPTESVPANPGGHRRPSRSEAEAAVRTPIESAGHDSDSEGLMDAPEREVRVHGDAPVIRASRPMQLPKMRASHGGALRSCTLHVCTSCRAPGTPREPQEGRPGFRLHEELRAMLQESRNGIHVEVRPAECLSMCRRPCGIAISSPGAWTYLFGDQDPGVSASDILECVSLYVGNRDGFMPRERRPKSLRASILGRVPPFGAGR